MRCRRIKDNEIIWFGSAGLDKTQPVYDNEGELIGYKAKKTENFADKQDAVANSLTQRLSVLKNELWYNMSYGLPLFDNIKSKVFMDSSVTQIIMQHPDVVRIESFSSNIVDKTYTFSCKIMSSYGLIEMNSSDVTV